MRFKVSSVHMITVLILMRVSTVGANTVFASGLAASLALRRFRAS